MRRAITFFVLVGILLFASLWLVENPGRVTVEWLGWRVETFFALFAMVLVVIVVLLAKGWRMFDATVAAPGSWFRRRADRRRESGFRALTHGLAAVAAGDPDEARRQAKIADSLLREPDLTRLLSAQAAALAGDTQAAARYFAALRENEETAFIGLTGLLRQAVARGDDAHALELSEQAFALRSEAPFVATTRLYLLARAERWYEAQRAVYETVKAGVLDEETGLRHRGSILVERAREALAADRVSEAIEYAGKAVDSQDDLAPALIELALAEKANGRLKRAIRVIEDNWARIPHPDLAAVFVDLVDDETTLATYRRLPISLGKRPSTPRAR